MPLCSGSASNDLTVDQMNPLSELVQGSKRTDMWCSSAGNGACVEVGAALQLRVKSDSSLPSGGGGGFISKYPSSELIPGRDRDFQLGALAFREMMHRTIVVPFSDISVSCTFAVKYIIQQKLSLMFLLNT